MKLILVISFSLTLISFGQDLVPFLKGDKYGYSDLEGNLIVKALYDDAYFMKMG